MLRHQGRPFAEWTNPPSYTVLLESEFTRLETQLITLTGTFSMCDLVHKQINGIVGYNKRG